MPARDTFPQIVRRALERDGWTITADPYTLSYGQRNVYVDFAANRALAAEKQGQKIAVEIKGFLGPSEVHELEVAVGQYVFYRSIMSRTEPDRHLYLAVPDDAFAGIFSERIAEPVLMDAKISLFTFDPIKEIIVQWIPQPPK